MRTWGVAWALAGTIVLVYGVAFACPRIPYTGVISGFLGLPFGAPSPTELVVPRNAAVVDMEIEDAVELRDETGSVIELEPVPMTVWSRPVLPLEAGSRVSIGQREATVGDVVDETPPSEPGLERARVHVATTRGSTCGCVIAESPCEGVETLHLTIEPSSDDFSPSELITYAVYGGSSAAEAEGAELPIRLLLPRDEDVLTETWGLGDTDHVAWVAVAAVDQAGNVSARTAPVRVERP